VEQLTDVQCALLDALTARLRDVEGVRAVVLGGSHARGRARPDSDLDVGIYYDDGDGLDVSAIRALAREISPSGADSVTDLWAWGPWVNGGAWLTIDDQAVDLLYRSLDQQESTIEAAEHGDYELHFGQQPPFGFFSPTLLGELEIARVLHDPQDRIAPLKERVATYPEALRTRVVGDFLWSAEFALHTFARKAAANGDAYLVTSTLARAAHALSLALFALNRRYLVNDKTALEEIDGFAIRPEGFGSRVRSVLAATGDSAERLGESVSALEGVLEEAAGLASDLYSPHWTLRD